MTAVVRARGLGKRYRRRWALSQCTLDIPAGRVVGLVGPNGAGKTASLSMSCRGRQLPIKLINIIDILTEVM